MGLTAGTRLGAYEILGAIGAGGMGEVYRARDPRLEREVAIKVLLGRARAATPTRSRASSAKRRASPGSRIRTSCRSTSSPATAAPSSSSPSWWTARRCARVSTPVRCRRVAPSVTRCRSRGHRRRPRARHRASRSQARERDDHARRPGQDPRLRPGQAVDPSGGDKTQRPTWRPAPGTVLGTFGYMAPGAGARPPVDHRADIFAFGAVLYEMLSGERAFKGETAADTMTAILDEGAAGARCRAAVHSPGARTHRPALSREDARSALPVGQRPRLRARHAVDDSPARHRAGGERRAPVVAPRAGCAWLPWAIAALAVARGAPSWCLEGRRPTSEARWDSSRGSPTPLAKRPRRRFAGWQHRGLCGSRGRQLGYLLATRRRPQRDADRQRSAA